MRGKDNHKAGMAHPNQGIWSINVEPSGLTARWSKLSRGSHPEEKRVGGRGWNIM